MARTIDLSTARAEMYNQNETDHVGPMYMKHVPYGNRNSLTLVSSQFTRTHLKRQAEKFK